MNAAAQRRLTPPLLMVALLLGALFCVLFAGFGRAVSWAPPGPAKSLPNPRAAKLPPPIPLEHFAVVWTRPLFSHDRKPVKMAANGDSNLGDMQLTGIILTRDLHVALLRDKGGAMVRVVEGKTLPDGNWTLAELRPRAAVFDSSSGRTELKLPNGAPIDMPAKDGAAAGAQAGDNAANRNGGTISSTTAQPGGAGVSSPGQAMVSDGTGRPRATPQTPQTLQMQRIQRFKEMMNKRRAEQAQKATEGER